MHVISQGYNHGVSLLDLDVGYHHKIVKIEWNGIGGCGWMDGDAYLFHPSSFILVPPPDALDTPLVPHQRQSHPKILEGKKEVQLETLTAARAR